jgi:hypothetical protein
VIRGVRSVAVLQCSTMVPDGDSNNQDVGQRRRGCAIRLSLYWYMTQYEF